MKANANSPCPCGSGAKLKRCCAVFHGGRPARPEQLMRARYTAYAIGNVAFIMDTTHPDSPLIRDRAEWKSDLAQYCRTTEFVSLQVHAHATDEDTGTATVEFTADLRQDGRDLGFHERSNFRLDGKRWKYVDGDVT